MVTITVVLPAFVNGVKIRRMSVSLYPYWNVWRIDMAVIRSFLELKY